MIYQPEDYTNINYTEVFIERQRRLYSIRSSIEKMVALRLYYSTGGAQACIDFIEDWVMTYDPRRKMAWLPFILFPRQKEFIKWLHERSLGAKELNDGLDKRSSNMGGLVEKSRDAGATWLCMAYSIWAWLFVDGVKIGFGSRKELLVDRIGDPDCIFEKGRMILNRLPVELLPQTFSGHDDIGFMKFLNRSNGNTITGEAGDNIGRGGRNTIYFVDESAFISRPQKIDASLSQNTECRFDVSTPNGSNNPFYRRRMKGKVGENVFVFDWRDDPRKDEDWYARKKKELDPVVLAQEVDRDYSGSAEGIVIRSEWIKAAIELALPTTGIKTAALDVADEGKDANAVAFRKGVVCSSVISWYKGNTAQTTKKAAFECRQRGIKELRYDKIGVGAGVKGEISNAGYDDITAIPINSADSPTPGWYIKPTSIKANDGKKNEDMFLNYRAQMWWLLRRRFEKTWEHVTGKRKYSYEELISIPNDHELIAEISSVTYKHSGSGKIQIESKKDMARRGVPSPNKGDALAMCYGPVRIKHGATWGRASAKAA